MSDDKRMPSEMTPEDREQWEAENAPPGSAAGYDLLMAEYAALKANRWAAFTLDELDELADWLPSDFGPGETLHSEVQAELERRRA